MSRYILGIDNGMLGYLCLYDTQQDNILLAFTPLQVGKLTRRSLHKEGDAVGDDYNVLNLARVIKQASKAANGDLVAVMEETLMGMGGGATNAQSVGALFRGRGIYETLCSLNGIPLYSVHPTSWKGRLGLKAKAKEPKRTSSQVKAAALALAQKLRPDVVFDTIDAAEAFLIAYAYHKHYAIN